MTTEIDKGHVSAERARELVESSPNLHPVRSGFVAEPLVQFKEGGNVENEAEFSYGQFEEGERVGPRYIVKSHSAHAPQIGGGKFRRPVHVRVYDTHHPEFRGYGSWGAAQEHNNVDSRYGGHKSAHGQALKQAHETASNLNHEHEEKK